MYGVDLLTTIASRLFKASHWQVHGQLLSETDVKALGWESHASLPTITKKNNAEKNEFLVLFSPRKANISRIAAGILTICDDDNFLFEVNDVREILRPGEIGTYNEAGVMPSFVSPYTWYGRNSNIRSTELNLYTCGWTSSETLPFHQEIGVHSFDPDSLEVGPLNKIIGRNERNPLYITNPAHIALADECDLMFFVSCSAWRPLAGGSLESEYHIKYELYHQNELVKEGELPRIDGQVASCRPWPIQVEDRLFIFFSARTTKADYNVYCCEFVDLDHFSWTGLPVINLGEGSWYSKMACYPSAVIFESRMYLVFCGDGYGSTGFGIASCDL